MTNTIPAVGDLAAISIMLLALVSSAITKNATAKLRLLMCGSLVSFLIALGGLFLFCLQSTSAIQTPQLAQSWPIRVDFLSALMLPVITFISCATVFYSERYLAAESSRVAFIQLLISLTLTSILFVFSNNLILSFACWHGVSLLLWKIVAIQGETKNSRTVLSHHLLSDGLMLLAFALLYLCSNTTNLSELYAASEGLKNAEGGTAPVITLIGFMMVLAATIKSALFPFHRWLIAILNAPTPLSGFLHAGVVNVSAILAARLFPVFSWPVLAAWAILSLASCIVGTLSMSAQTDVKRKLVYSTVGQMGFMCFQCALGAVPAAVFHMVAHGFFKCHMFLQSASAVTEGGLKRRWGAKQEGQPVGFNSGRIAVFGVILAFSIVLLQQSSFDGRASLTALVAGAAIASSLPAFRRISSFSLVLCASLYMVFATASNYLSHSLIAYFDPIGGGTHQAWLTVCLFGLAALGTIIFLLRDTDFGRAIYVHSLNGFYLDEVVAKWLPVSQMAQRSGGRWQQRDEALDATSTAVTSV